MTVLESYGSTNEDTPIMDSFIKESARFYPVQTSKLIIPWLIFFLITFAQPFSI